MLRSKSRSGYLDFGQKKHSSVLIRTISGSKICRGDALASQVDKEALVSVDRKSISLSENRIVKAAMMQKQMSNLEEELKNTKERLDAAEGERNQALTELRETKELANSGLSPKRAQQVFSELKSLKDSLSSSRNEIETRDKNMTLLSTQLEAAKVFELKLAEREASLEEMKKLVELKDSEARALSENKTRIQELEDQLEKAKQSDLSMMESLMFQTRQIEQTKMDLEESKLENASLREKLEKLQKGSKNGQNGYGLMKESMVDRKANLEGEKIRSPETEALTAEIRMLKNELKFATEAEENSKRAMDDLASVLREVATEATMAKEKQKLAEAEVTHLKEETDQLKEMLRTIEDKHQKQIDELNNEIELQMNTVEQLRVEAEESLLAWNGKEMGFVSCIRKADEEGAMAKHENNRLKEALVASENSTRIAREEAYKLRDILKQAINESNVAKEAANIARAENSELKDLLAEKEEALHFLTKENERLRINEVAARENIKEFKRLLAAKAEVRTCDDKEQTDVFNSPLSSLYEDHLDGRTTPQQTFSFDLDDMQIFNKEEEDYVTDIVVHEDPEKAEALKGSIFDTSSPRSEPHTPKPKVHLRIASLLQAFPVGISQSEDAENVHSSSSHTEDTDDKSFYSRKKLFKKIGELIIGKSYSKKEVPTEQDRDQAQAQAN